MKKYLRLFFIFIILLSLTGCRALDRAENAIENSVDAIEESVEQTVKDIILPVQKPEPTQPPENNTPTIITPENAQIVALEHAGVSADEVSRLHTKMDMDDGRQEYDVEFHVGFWEYEYEIDAATGTILSWNKDD